MPFGGKKEQRVIQVESEAERRAKLLSEVMTDLDIVERAANVYIRINLMMWREIKSDANIPEDKKAFAWEVSVKEFWETMRAHGFHSISLILKRTSDLINELLIKKIMEEK